MQARHAYLVLAHNQFELLKVLCRCLDNPRNDIFIHVDKKSKFDISDFKQCTQFSKIIILERRVHISWGSFSMVKAELELLRAATPGEYMYYHLLSGVDLPLCSADRIHQFFLAHQGKEFIHFSEAAFIASSSVQNRAKFYHILQQYSGRGNGVLGFAEKCIVWAQKVLGVNRLKKMDAELMCGSQWFSITHDLAQYILEKEHWIQVHFAQTSCPDELVIQTIAYNSPFREHLFVRDDKGGEYTAMRYIDLKRGSPYTFQPQDYDELISCDFLFARKFDFHKTPELCKKIATRVLK